jgi:hypothetical protein
MKYAIIFAAASILAGCATHDPRDAPWDPPAGRQLFEQIPAWDGAANRICCGGKAHCGPGQSPRC